MTKTNIRRKVLVLTNSLNTPPSSWNLAATKSNSSIWCSPAEFSVLYKMLQKSQSKSTVTHVRTRVGSGVKHVVQHGIVVHVKPVSDVSQSVRATQIRQVQVKENRRQITISVTWQRFSRRYIYSCRAHSKDTRCSPCQWRLLFRPSIRPRPATEQRLNKKERVLNYSVSGS